MQLELNFAVVLNSAPVQYIEVGDRVKRKGDPYSLYEVAYVSAEIAKLRCIASGPGRSGKDLSAPLSQLHRVPVETVLEQLSEQTVLEQLSEQTVLEQLSEQTAPEQTAPEQTPQWIESYSPSNRKGYVYYRYVWMDNRKLHHIHIHGNVESDRARLNFMEVSLAIAMKKHPSEIEQMIRSWRQRRI